MLPLGTGRRSDRMKRRFLLLADTVAKVEIEQHQKSRESRFLADSIAAKLHSADTRIGGRLCLK